MPIDTGPSDKFPRKIRLSSFVKSKLNANEQSLREILNNPIRDVVNTEASGPVMIGLPPYGGQPLIVGSELAKYYDKFRNLAPNLDTRMNRIQFGPGSVATERLQGQRNYYDPANFGISTLLGVTNPLKGETNINPNLGSPEWLRHIGMTSEYGDYPPDQILLHELTHAAGYLGEEKPKEAEEIYKRMRK